MCRKLSSIAVSVMAMWGVGTVGACQSEATDEQAQLQALLHDEALQQVPPSAAPRAAQGVTAAFRTGATSAATSDPPVGAWDFDDCSADHTQLADTTGSDNTAFRSVNVAASPASSTRESRSRRPRTSCTYPISRTSRSRTVSP
jgi:hypothetical protein